MRFFFFFQKNQRRNNRQKTKKKKKKSLKGNTDASIGVGMFNGYVKYSVSCTVEAGNN